MLISNMPFTRTELLVIERALKTHKWELRMAGSDTHNSEDVQVHDLRAKVGNLIDMMV